MVVGTLRIEETTKVKNNPFYGDYEAKSVFTRTLVNQKYVGLVSPKAGIHITIKGTGGDIDIYLNKYYFEGIPENEADKDDDFSISFTYGGHVYEVTVDACGQLITLCEWLNIGDFEDCLDPDNVWRKRSKGIKWELIEM
jgi:hypothetical protein